MESHLSKKGKKDEIKRKIDTEGIKIKRAKYTEWGLNNVREQKRMDKL